MPRDTVKIISVYCPVCGKVYDTKCYDKLKSRGYCEICDTEYNENHFKHIWGRYSDMHKHTRGLHDKWIKEGNVCI